MTVTDPVVVRGPGPRRPRVAVPVVPPDLRRPAAVLAAVCALAVAAWGLVVRGASRPGRVDQVLAVAVRRHVTESPLAFAVDGLVAPVPALVVVGVLTGACLALRRARLAAVALVAPLGSYLVTSAAKTVVGRTIHGDNLSYPSGHAAFATAVGLVVGLLLAARLRRPGRPGREGRLLAALLVLLPGLLCGLGMAFDQVLIDAHYPTDTLGGIATAVAVVLGAGLLVDVLAERLRSSA